MLHKIFLFWVVYFSCFSSLFAGGIRGTVKDPKGEPMPYTSIFVKNTAIGTMANTEGYYEIQLTEGSYQILFQFIGYQSIERSVSVEKGQFISLDVVMQETVFQLKEATVTNSKEDPALTIMRKTIAMSPYHHRELKSYSLRNYVRGSFQVNDVPFFLEKELKKNFITKGQTYVLESVNEIKFKQPNSLSERVLSVRSNFPPTMKGNEGISFSRINLYNPANVTSPVTAKGSVHYRYTYLGYFEDKGLIINKIRVTPKVKSSDYVSGTLNIIEGSWYIHSLDFELKEAIGSGTLKVIYSPIEEIWLPIQATSTFKASVVGIEGEAKFVTSFKNYSIVKDPAFANVKPQLLDDKIFKEEAQSKEKQIAQQKELTVSQLKQLYAQVEKQEKKEKRANKETIVESIYNKSEDSFARKQDTTFWEKERQITLTHIEQKSFQSADSLYKLDEKKIAIKLQKDSLQKARPAQFKPRHLLTGNNYPYQLLDPTNRKKGYKHYFLLGNWFENLRFNAVEGVVIGLPSLGYRQRMDTLQSFSVMFEPNYSFHRKHINASFKADYTNKKATIGLDFGRNVTQLNAENPIPTLVNTSYALLKNKNYAKLYEKTYARFFYEYKTNERFSSQLSFTAQNRIFLDNVLQRSPLFSSQSGIFEANFPEKSTQKQAQYTIGTTFSFNPFATVRYYNNRKYTTLKSPSFVFRSWHSFAPTPFHQLEIEATHSFKVGLSTLKLRTESGVFLGKKELYFADYKHFNGNEQLLQTHADFRVLLYYQFSTNSAYLQLFGTTSFQRLFITQLPFIQKKGWKEELYSNFLATKNTNHLEVGYTLSEATGLLKLDVYQSFQKSKISAAGIRLHYSF